MNTSHLISSTKCENMSSHGAKRKLCGWMVDAQPCETAAKPRETRAKRAKHPAKRPRNTRETSRNMRETQRILCEFDANPCSGPAAHRVPDPVAIDTRVTRGQRARVDDGGRMTGLTGSTPSYLCSFSATAHLLSVHALSTSSALRSTLYVYHTRMLAEHRRALPAGARAVGGGAASLRRKTPQVLGAGRGR